MYKCLKKLLNMMMKNLLEKLELEKLKLKVKEHKMNNIEDNLNKFNQDL